MVNYYMYIVHNTASTYYWITMSPLVYLNCSVLVLFTFPRTLLYYMVTAVPRVPMSGMKLQPPE